MGAIIVFVAVSMFLLSKIGVLDGTFEVAGIILFVIGLVVAFGEGIGKDANAYGNMREYWRKRGSGPHDQRTTRYRYYNRKNRRRW